jgi:hypothetical protein
MEVQMYRFLRRTLSILTVVLSLSALLAAGAQAKPRHITGQQTTITPSAQATQFLTNHHVTVSPLGAATIANGALTLPISGGFVTTPRLRALVLHRGGVKFSVAKRSFALRAFVLSRVGHRTVLSATVDTRRLIVARVTGLTQTIVGKQAMITGELKLSAQAAHKINRRFGKHLVSAGADIGSLASIVTVA